MSAVGLVLHHHRDEATGLARELVDWLQARDHDVRLPPTDAAVIDRRDLEVPARRLAEGIDLAVSIGGDGTMLRTVDLVTSHDVPVLGFHAGQLGYLTEVEATGATDALAKFFAGDHGIEERMLLSVRVDAPSNESADIAHLALNEAVLEKASSGHTVRLGVTIDDNYFAAYETDGLIVATPTGSTAYALSARGPIIAPAHRALLLTPVSPHMLFDRSLVLEPGTVIRVEVTGYRPAALFVDGRESGVLTEGDAVLCTAADQPVRLVTFGPRNFHGILKAKFGLNDR